MWKKLTAIDQSEFETELWVNDEARIAYLRQVRSNVCVMVFEGGAEARVKGTPDEIIAALGATMSRDAPKLAGDRTTHMLE